MYNARLQTNPAKSQYNTEELSIFIYVCVFYNKQVYANTVFTKFKASDKKLSKSLSKTAFYCNHYYKGKNIIPKDYITSLIYTTGNIKHTVCLQCLPQCLFKISVPAPEKLFAHHLV